MQGTDHEHWIASESNAPTDARHRSTGESHADRYFWDNWHVTHRPEDFESRAKSGGDEGESAAAAEDAEKSLASAPASTTTASLADAVALAALSDKAPRRAAKSPRAAVPRGAASKKGAGVQYSMLRTPAAEYFAPADFEQLCIELSEFGRQQLGCDAFTPPWLALYLDGHEMAWHTDAPHGPWVPLFRRLQHQKEASLGKRGFPGDLSVFIYDSGLCALAHARRASRARGLRALFTELAALFVLGNVLGELVASRPLLSPSTTGPCALFPERHVIRHVSERGCLFRVAAR